MKKLLLVSLLFLAACVNNSDKYTGVTRLDSEPSKNECEFLYKMNTSVSAYKLSDAYEFLEKSVLEQNGDSYYIDKQLVLENPEALFGPGYTYKFVVKIYNCKK